MHNTLTERVFNCIREKIIFHEFRPGQRIDIGELVNELSVSPIPIREALQKLRAHGLVEYRPYAGFFVRRFSSKEIAEIFEVRLVLEKFALQQGFSYITEDDLKELWSLVSEAKEKPKEIEKFNKKIDWFLHKLILKRAGNSFLLFLMGFIDDYIEFVRHLVPRGIVDFKEHVQIIEALKRKDLKGALQALEKHIRAVKEDTLKQL